MGYYIQTEFHTDKASQLVDTYGAIPLPGPLTPFEDIPEWAALVCVVQNGLFDAAALVYDERELADFSLPDGRPRTWLLMDRKVAFVAAGAEHLLSGAEA